jgi:hypothetical protein
MRLLNAFSFAFLLSQLFFKTIPAQASRRLPSFYNRHRPVRQFRAPAIPFRVATHERLATSASRFHNTILSYRPLLKSSSGIKLSAHFCPRADATADLWQTHCLRGMVFARCSVTGDYFSRARTEREATGLSCRYKPKWIQSSYAIFALLRTSTTANPRSPIACWK